MSLTNADTVACRELAGIRTDCFCLEFQSYPSTIHTKILPIYWNICVLCKGEILRVLIFNLQTLKVLILVYNSQSLSVFLKQFPEVNVKSWPKANVLGTIPVS